VISEDFIVSDEQEFLAMLQAANIKANQPPERAAP